MLSDASMKILVACGFVRAALAAVQPWGQCGGINYNGDTSCASGTGCNVINEYYYQCVPGAAATPVPTNAASTLVTSVRASATPASPGNGGAAAAPPSHSGTKFTIDGKTGYYAGTNSYWISFLGNTADVDKTLDTMVSGGLKVLRVWGFNDVRSDPGSGTVWFQLLSSSGSRINTGANGLQRLDYVVSAAEKRGIKLIIPFVNYWDDYGGMSAYVAAFGGSKTSWYTNTAAQNQYKTYISTLVNRYKASSAIFAWELANEPRCAGCATSVITNWARSTSAYIKSLDSTHMVAIGDEGFGLSGGDGSYPYQSSEGLDFAANLAISTIDFGTLHLYPSSWGTSYDWGNAWITNHGNACAAAGKPCMVEEYGSSADHCGIESKWQSSALASAGTGGDMFWQIGVQLSYGQSANDGFTIYSGSSEWTCLVTNHVAKIPAPA